jgi:hypothetical protein
VDDHETPRGAPSTTAPPPSAGRELRGLCRAIWPGYPADQHRQDRGRHSRGVGIGDHQEGGSGEEAHGVGPAAFDGGAVAAGGQVGGGGEVGAVAGLGGFAGPARPRGGSSRCRAARSAARSWPIPGSGRWPALGGALGRRRVGRRSRTPPGWRGWAGRRSAAGRRGGVPRLFGDAASGAYLVKFSWTDIVRHTPVTGGTYAPSAGTSCSPPISHLSRPTSGNAGGCRSPGRR